MHCRAWYCYGKSSKVQNLGCLVHLIMKCVFSHFNSAQHSTCMNRQPEIHMTDFKHTQSEEASNVGCRAHYQTIKSHGCEDNAAHNRDI